MSVDPGPPRSTDREGHARSTGWPWFVAWLLVGGAYALSVLGALTIGIFVLPIAIGATVVLAMRPQSRVGLLGLLSGCGLPLLYIAYLNRDGPGTVCTRTATEVSCTDEWSPWPFLVIGIALVLAGVLLFLRNGSPAAAGRPARD